MNHIYTHAIQRLQHLGDSLSKKALFVEKPWTLIDNEQEIQRLIFKNDKRLIISKNGNVIMGKWDYLPEAKSILIDRGTDIILCNEGFVDQAAMILKKDGTNNQFFVLANANILPDLDVKNYIMNLTKEKLKIHEVKIKGGRILEVQPRIAGQMDVGDKVSENLTEIADGEYSLENEDMVIVVRQNKILSFIHYLNYRVKTGEFITVAQRDQYYFDLGDKVFINTNVAPDGKYKLKGRANIKVENGKIVKKTYF